MPKIKSILFVCTGNSCRSVMAEGLLKKALRLAGKEHIKVNSAGVGAIDGMAPTDETIRAMKSEGIDVLGSKSKRVTARLVSEADLILVMAAHHMDDIISRFPDAAAKTHLLRQYGVDCQTQACEDLDVIDPISQAASVYENVLKEIKKEIERIVKLL